MMITENWFLLIIQFINVYRTFRCTIRYWVFFLHELAFLNFIIILKVIPPFPRSIVLSSVCYNWFQEADFVFMLLLLYCPPFHMKEI